MAAGAVRTYAGPYAGHPFCAARRRSLAHAVGLDLGLLRPAGCCQRLARPVAFIPRQSLSARLRGGAAGRRSVLRLPEGYCRVLDCLHGPSTFGEILNRVPQYAGCGLADWLGRLEKMGLVESVSFEWIEELIALGRYEGEPARMPE